MTIARWPNPKVLERAANHARGGSRLLFVDRALILMRCDHLPPARAVAFSGPHWGASADRHGHVRPAGRWCGPFDRRAGRHRRPELLLHVRTTLGFAAAR